MSRCDERSIRLYQGLRHDATFKKTLLGNPRLTWSDQQLIIPGVIQFGGDQELVSGRVCREQQCWLRQNCQGALQAPA